MRFCKRKDELIDLLKDFGYNPVALPREGIVPLQVLEKKNGSFQQTTHLKELFIPNSEYLPPSLPKLRPALDIIKGKQSSLVDSKIGIKVLEKWVKVLGGNSVGLESAYSNVDKFIFEFNNAKVRQLDWSKLDKYINNAKLNFDSKAYIEKIKRNELYVIVSTLLSNSFTVQAIDKSGMSMKSHLSNSELGEVSTEIQKDNHGNTKIEYRGYNNLIFGVKAVKLRYEESNEGNFYFNIIDAKRAVLRSSDESLPAETLLIKENFIYI